MYKATALTSYLKQGERRQPTLPSILKLGSQLQQQFAVVSGCSRLPHRFNWYESQDNTISPHNHGVSIAKSGVIILKNQGKVCF